MTIPKELPVYFQSFRILVELLLLYTFREGIIPISATFEGLNFDILMGISAIPMGYFVFRKKEFNLILAKAWNILGIGMILFVALIIGTSLYFPALWGNNPVLINGEFMLFPYVLVPVLLAPMAIFMHIVSLRQLKKQSHPQKAIHITL